MKQKPEKCRALLTLDKPGNWSQRENAEVADWLIEQARQVRESRQDLTTTGLYRARLYYAKAARR